jgi:hypothetical protein
VHEVALVELHVSVEAPPLATTVGFAVSVAVGTGLTVIAAVAAALVPPGPAQLNEYEVFALSALVLRLPLATSAPLQPPEAVHEVALVELHVSVEALPAATVVGFAVKVAVGTTLTTTVAAVLVPPAPVQVSEYDVFILRAPVFRLPLVASAPIQPPEAVQEVALVELQVSVEAPPLVTVVGFAVKVAVGAELTVIVAVAVVLVPPGPAQVSEYDVFVLRAPVLRLPLIASAPVQPPEAVHAVALVELQVSVEALPAATMVGLAVSVAVGTGFTVIAVVAAALVPPGPVQLNEKEEFFVSAPVLRLPPAGSAPLQPPEAVHEVALVELHVSVEAPPLVTAVGFAVKVAVGTTLTIAVAAALVPPGPAQISEYDVVDLMAPVPRLPLASSAPLQPPEAVHEVALFELQVSVEAPPAATVVGLALKVAVGTGLSVAGATVTVAVTAVLAPPGPAQLNEKEEFFVSAPVL